MPTRRLRNTTTGASPQRWRSFVGIVRPNPGAAASHGDGELRGFGEA